MSSIPGLGVSHGGGNGNPLQYSCLKNPMDGGAWQATVAKSRTRLPPGGRRKASPLGSRPLPSSSLRPHGLQPTRLLHPWDFPGKHTGVDCHFLLQEVFPTQGSNLGLWHCRQILYHLSHPGKPSDGSIQIDTEQNPQQQPHAIMSSLFMNNISNQNGQLS